VYPTNTREVFGHNGASDTSKVSCAPPFLTSTPRIGDIAEIKTKPTGFTQTNQRQPNISIRKSLNWTASKGGSSFAKPIQGTAAAFIKICSPWGLIPASVATRSSVVSLRNAAF
jgi:hypothetical protein